MVCYRCHDLFMIKIISVLLSYSPVKFVDKGNTRHTVTLHLPVYRQRLALMKTQKIVLIVNYIDKFVNVSLII